jgi:hypothetical protein
MREETRNQQWVEPNLRQQTWTTSSYLKINNIP